MHNPHLYVYYLLAKVSSLQAHIDGHRYALSPYLLRFFNMKAQVIEAVPPALLRVDETMIRGDTAFVKMGAAGSKAMIPFTYSLPAQVRLVEPVDDSIVARIGRFNVRLVRKGDRYGLNDCLVGHDEPLVEFYSRADDYDPRFDGRGQYVSRYYLATLQQHPTGIGLQFQGHAPDLRICAEELRQAVLASEGRLLRMREGVAV